MAGRGLTAVATSVSVQAAAADGGDRDFCHRKAVFLSPVDLTATFPYLACQLGRPALLFPYEYRHAACPFQGKASQGTIPHDY